MTHKGSTALEGPVKPFLLEGLNFFTVLTSHLTKPLIYLKKINHCCQHACPLNCQHARPFGLKVYTTFTQSHRSRHKCVRHQCQNKCSRDQNWHFECSFDFSSVNNGYE